MSNDPTVSAYLTALASKAPTPGGGSAAALSGAQASALMAMVSRLTRGQSDEIGSITERADAAITRFRHLLDEDQLAFKAVMVAYKLPSDSRANALQAALKTAAQTPLTMMELAGSLAPDCCRLVTIGNKNLLTDTGIAALFLEATIQAARLNVLVNLASIDDPEFVGVTHDAMNQVIPRLDEIRAAFTRTLNTYA